MRERERERVTRDLLDQQLERGNVEGRKKDRSEAVSSLLLLSPQQRAINKIYKSAVS